MKVPDVVVVGGGVIGLAVAWRAAQRDLAVTVVDPTPGQGASSVAAGMLAPVTEVHYGEEPLLRLNLDSARRWPGFAEELEAASGLPVGYRPVGTVAVALDADDNRALEELFRFQSELGLPVERLRGRECRELEPWLAPRARGGILVAGDHQVDSRALVAALEAAAQKAGVELLGERATAVQVAGDRARGVAVHDRDPLDAGAVVLAAGCWSASIGGLPPEAVPPVRPVKGQVVHVRGPAQPPLIGHNVRGLVRGSSLYLVPRADGRVIIGATVEEQGFDTTVTAGAAYELLRDAVELVPGLTELELDRVEAGLRPGTPDNAPLLGPSPVDGLVVATGHYRNGILLTPATADAIAHLLATGDLPAEIAPFSPARFAEAGIPA